MLPAVRLTVALAEAQKALSNPFKKPSLTIDGFARQRLQILIGLCPTPQVENPKRERGSGDMRALASTRRPLRQFLLGSRLQVSSV